MRQFSSMPALGADLLDKVPRGWMLLGLAMASWAVFAGTAFALVAL
jgi:disulfide bond formation protein DsbB